MHPYAYLIGDLIFFVPWLLLFVWRKDLRREMITMSFIGGLFFPLALIYLPDYWYPEHAFSFERTFMLGIEDFLFAFFIAGIGSIFYEVTFGKIHRVYKHREKNVKRLISIIIVAVVVTLGLTFIFKLNSIYSSYIAFLIIFGYIIYFRRDLLLQSILSGLGVGIIMLVFYVIWTQIYPGIIEHWWRLDNISGILIFGAPLEEIIWGFTWGVIGGTFYEFTNGIKIIKNN